MKAIQRYDSLAQQIETIGNDDRELYIAISHFFTALLHNCFTKKKEENNMNEPFYSVYFHIVGTGDE